MPLLLLRKKKQPTLLNHILKVYRSRWSGTYLFSRIKAKVVPDTLSKLSRIGYNFQWIAITMKLLQLISDIIPKSVFWDFMFIYANWAFLDKIYHKLLYYKTQSLKIGWSQIKNVLFHCWHKKTKLKKGLCFSIIPYIRKYYLQSSKNLCSSCCWYNI